MTRTWWQSPSTWAPQRGFRVFSREQDWALLAAIEGDGSVERAAKLIGVSPLAAEQRAFALAGECAAKHWKQRSAVA